MMQAGQVADPLSQPPGAPERRPAVPRWVWLVPIGILVVLVVTYFGLRWYFSGDVLDGPAHVDFGTVALDGPNDSVTLARVVTLTNAGRTTLDVQSSRVTCTCLGVDAPTGPIEPGESIDVRVRITVSEDAPQGGYAVLQFSNGRFHRIEVSAVGTWSNDSAGEVRSAISRGQPVPRPVAASSSVTPGHDSGITSGTSLIQPTSHSNASISRGPGRLNI